MLPTTVSPDRIGSIGVLATMADGMVTHDPHGLLAEAPRG
jgi:hypothetical protein